jgi:hypothetical protein
VLVTSRTVVAWHRAGFRLSWHGLPVIDFWVFAPPFQYFIHRGN